jgi:hypothetical protein
LTGARHRSSPSCRNARRALLRAAIRAEVVRVEGLVVGLRHVDPTDGAVVGEWAIERSRRNVDLSHASSDAHRSAIIGGGPLRAVHEMSGGAGGEGALLRPCHARSSRERGRYAPHCSASAVRATRQTGSAQLFVPIRGRGGFEKASTKLPLRLARPRISLGASCRPRGAISRSPGVGHHVNAALDIDGELVPPDDWRGHVAGKRGLRLTAAARCESRRARWTSRHRSWSRLSSR